MKLNSWTDLVNISIGASGIMVSLLGMFLCFTSHLLEMKIRRHLIAIFAVVAVYSGVLIPCYIPVRADLVRMSIFLMSVLAALLMPILTSLMLSFTGESPRRSRLFLLTILLLAVYACMLISTFFVPVFYSIDDAGVYTRGPLYPLLLFPPVLIMILNLWGLQRRRKQLTTKQYQAFLVYLIIPLFSMVIQMLYYGILATAFGTIVGAVIMFLIILNDQQDTFIKVTEENANREFAIRILQMRPHFIYNTMTSIYYIVEEDPERARRVIRDFTTYLRRVFGAVTSRVPVPFSEELEHTRAYLAVESARFPEQLSISYDIMHSDFLLPPLTLQPVVENAIKHGMDPEIDVLNVIIRTRAADGYSEITVENDGENFVTPYDREEESIGLGSTRDRLKRMCGGDLSIAQREGRGTIVTIRIPAG